MKAAERIRELMEEAARGLQLAAESDEPDAMVVGLGAAGQLVVEAIAEGEKTFVGFREGVMAAAGYVQKYAAKVGG